MMLRILSMMSLSMMIRSHNMMSLLDQLDQYIMKQVNQVIVAILTWKPEIPRDQGGGTTPLEMFR